MSIIYKIQPTRPIVKQCLDEERMLIRKRAKTQYFDEKQSKENYGQALRGRFVKRPYADIDKSPYTTLDHNEAKRDFTTRMCQFTERSENSRRSQFTLKA